MMYGFYDNYNWSCGPFGNFGGNFMMLAFWLLLIVLFILVIRRFAGQHTSSSAMETLKERYAKGEIKKEEFEEKKKDLIKS